MKKLVISIFSICLLLSAIPGTITAYSNEFPSPIINAIFEEIGSSDELPPLQNTLNASTEEDTLKQKFAIFNEICDKIVTTEQEDETNCDYQNLYDDFVNNNIDKEPKLDVPEASLYAISYYPGTTIPTFTSITGKSLYNTIYSDDGEIVSYIYSYNVNSHFDYINYLIDYCGWYYYDDSTASDNSYAVIFLVKGDQMIGIVANFKTLLTTIMFEIPTTYPTSITLDTSSRTMIVGNQYTLKATISPSAAANNSVTWSSSNTNVATVSSAGVVKAKSAGSTTITAQTSNGKKATCSITVKSLVLNYYPNTKIPTFTCITGKSIYRSMENDGITMYFYTYDASSHVNYELYLRNTDGWTFLSEETASDYSYVTTGYKKDDVMLVIMANFENGFTIVGFDTPQPIIPITSVALDKTSSTITVGDTISLTETVLPSNATNKSVTWSSSNSNVASVSSSGTVTAKSEGTATITVTTVDGNKTASCTITVKPPVVSVSSINLNKTAAEITEGDTLTLSATVEPSNATNKNVIWTCDNTSVATVFNGTVKAIAPGVATITATTEDGNKVACCIITVKTKVDTLFIIGEVRGKPGDTIKVPITLENSKVIDSLSIRDFSYNKEYLEFVGLEKNDEFVKDALFVAFDDNKQTIAIGWQNASSYSKELGKIIFKIKDNAPEGTYNISASSLVKIKSDIITSDVADGKITVAHQAPGDINLDDTVDISDAIFLFQHTMMPDIYLIENYTGNLNFDGKDGIDIGDAIYLFQHSMMPDVYPL